MTTVIAPSPDSLHTDADLLLAARGGDRHAFSQIVQRYQSMVTGLTFAACGNLHRSEDLAQETFLAAWKALPSLRDPAKLPGWLCQIARNRLIDLARKETSEQAHLQTLQEQIPVGLESPTDPLLIAEERELLWRTLAQIPQPYRDTLVLYYRQSQSSAAVAAALEVSEETIRQRLTRGREMLREHLAVVLERNLAMSAPTSAFTQSVLAAIPITSFPIAATALKSATAAKYTGLTPFLLLWSGPIIGFGGALVGTVSGVRSAASPVAKKFARLHAFFLWALILAIVAEQIFLSRLHLAGPSYMVAQSVTWSLYGILIATGTFLINRRLVALQHPIVSALAAAKSAPERSLFVGVSLTLGATVGALGWMFHPAFATYDAPAILIIAFLAFFILPYMTLKISCIVQKRALRNKTENPGLFAGQLFAFTLISSIAISLSALLHWRLYIWLAALHNTEMAKVQSQYPLWPVDLGALALVVYTAALLLVAKKYSARRSCVVDVELGIATL